MSELVTPSLLAIDHDPVELNDPLNEVACLMVSLVMHFGLLLPLLVLWINVKAPTPDPPQRVTVRFRSPGIAPTLAQSPVPATLPAGSEIEAAAPVRRRRRTATPAAPSRLMPGAAAAAATLPVSRPLSSSPRLEAPGLAYPASVGGKRPAIEPKRSVATGLPVETPTVASAGPGTPGPLAATPNLESSAASATPEMGSGTQTGTGDAGQRLRDSELTARAEELAARGGSRRIASPLGFPVSLPIPLGMRRMDPSKMKFRFTCSVSSAGRMTDCSIQQSSGVPLFDQMLLSQMRSMEWRPALRDGRAVDSVRHLLCVSRDKKYHPDADYMNIEGPHDD